MRKFCRGASTHSDSWSSANCTGYSQISYPLGERLAHKSLWGGHLFDVRPAHFGSLPLPFYSFFLVNFFRWTSPKGTATVVGLLSFLALSCLLPSFQNFPLHIFSSVSFQWVLPSTVSFTHGIQSHLQIHRSSGSKPFYLPHFVGGEGKIYVTKEIICPSSGYWQHFTPQPTMCW